MCQNKTVPILENKTAGERCRCYLLDFYISKLPKEVKERDLFYMYVRPLLIIEESCSTMVHCCSVGCNTLNHMVPKMCSEAKFSSRMTNHSLRATGATELYDAGVPEKIIKECTGHRSTDGLRVYERTSQKQHQTVSHILSSTQHTHFVQEMERLHSPAVPTQPVPC